ncbi:unnamed protein product [Pipistrellus nathusii]|uniref:Proline-rich protein 32 n=1 Tax=Pipistrellus nathusii TaxID=59473 RepID=A0ABP0AKI9_PIPNA
MACMKNVLEEHASSPIAMAVDRNVKPRPNPKILRLISSTTLKNEVESWGKPRMPLRPPLYVPPDLAKGQLEGPTERKGSCIPANISRALKHPYGLRPAAEKGSQATVKINGPVGLAGCSQMGQDSITVSQKSPGCSPSLMIEGTRVSNEGTENGVNKAKPQLALQQGQGFFPPRAPLIRDPPPNPTIRTGITMEVPPGNMKMAGNERMAHVAFSMGGPWNPMDNWPRPITAPPNVSHLGWFPNGPCFIGPVPPNLHPFLNLPMPFPPHPMCRPPLFSYFGHFPPTGMQPHPYLNRENRS